MSKSTHHNVYFTPLRLQIRLLILGCDTIHQKIISMDNKDFTASFLVDNPPTEAFNAITNVRAWWSEEIKGNTRTLGEEFYYHYKDVHTCTMKLVELVPGKKAAWLVLNNHFNFIKDDSEWVGTKIIFDITEEDGETKVQFTHQGLTPAYECYNICHDAWSKYIKTSLRNLIVVGKGQPNPKES